MRACQEGGVWCGAEGQTRDLHPEGLSTVKLKALTSGYAHRLLAFECQLETMESEDFAR